MEKFSFFIILAIILTVPMILDPNLLNFHIIPKQYVFGGLVLLALLLWAGRTILSRRVYYKQSILDKVLGGLVLVSLISAIFAPNKMDAFMGRGEFFVLSFVSLLFFAILYILLTNHVTTTSRWRLVMDFLVFTGGLSALIFILKTVFNYDILSQFGIPVWNVIEPLNTSFGIWLVAILMLSAGQVIKKDFPMARSVFNFVVGVLSFACIILMGLKMLWWMLLLGLILLMVLGVTFLKEARLGWLTALFATLILSVVFIIFGSPKSLQYAIPPEASLGPKASWQITLKNVSSGVKNFFIGSGPGSFGVGFSKFRSPDFNNDPLAWSLRFNQPYNSLFGLLSEIGVVGLILFVVLAMFYLGHVFYLWLGLRAEKMFYEISSTLGWQKEDIKFEVFLVAMTWLLLSIGLALSFFSHTMWWMWWMLLGLGVTGLGFMHKDIYQIREWEIEDSPQYSLSFSFLLIVLAFSMVMSGVLGARLYMSEVAYASASRGGNLDTVEMNVKRAISLKPNSDVYKVALAQVYLKRAVDLSASPTPDLQQISLLVSEAVNTARQATDVSPESIGVWENLATMYENAAAIVPESREWAIKSWLRTTELEPSNPVLWYKLGVNYLAAGKNEEAKSSFEEAVKLKPNFLAALIGLTKYYEGASDLDNAVATYEKILPLSQGNLEVFYDYGRILYNRDYSGDRDKAEQIWLGIIEQNKDYSNVLYSLGTLYENKGALSRALDYYYRVKELNPGNPDITKKINSLVQ